LGQVGVVLAGEEGVPIPSDNAFDKAVATGVSLEGSPTRKRIYLPAVDVKEKAFHGGKKMD
jgi:hypothetical protein